MKKQLWILLFALTAFSAIKAQTTGVQGCVINGFGQPSAITNSTTGYVYTILGPNLVGWAAPTGSSSDLFKLLAVTNKTPAYGDTLLGLRYGGTGYQTTQNKYICANFINAKQRQWAGSIAQIKWAFFGDSYSEIIYQYMPKVFQNICGAGPVSGYSGAFGTGAGLGVTGNVGKADTGVIDQIMRFKEISGGNTIEISKGGVGHFGLGGTAFTATKITVAYITQPLGGTIKMQVNNGTYVAINTFSATIGIGFYTFRQAATSSTLRILNSSTSKDSDEIAFIGMEDTLVNGLTVFHLGVGGISLDSCVAGNITGTQNLATFMNYENPTVWTAEMKEDTLYASGRTYRQDLDTFYTRMTFRDTGLRHADVFLYGSPPISTGGNEQYVQNQMVQSICLLFGFNYYDTYALWGGYAKLVQDGMQGDGTHVNATANIYRGWKFLTDCGFLYNQTSATTAIDSIHFSSMSGIGTPYIGLAAPALLMGTHNGYDLYQNFSRDDTSYFTGNNSMYIKGGGGFKADVITSAGNVIVGSGGSAYVGGPNAYLNCGLNTVNTLVGGLTISNASGNGTITFQRTGSNPSGWALLYSSNATQQTYTGSNGMAILDATSVATQTLTQNAQTTFGGAISVAMDTAKYTGTGATKVVALGKQGVIFKGAGGTSITVTLPTSPQQGQIFIMKGESNWATVTLVSTGYTFSNPPTAIVAGQLYVLILNGTVWE